LFGMSNQLLASSALIIGTTMIMRMNKVKYAWITAVPGILMAFITMYAGYLNVVGNFLPKKLYLLTTLSIIIMVLMVIVFVGAIGKWFELLKIKTTVVDEYGERVLEIVPE
jgi:carbon starvation protein